MTEDEIREWVAGHLDGVRVQVAAEGDGSPELAWGDSFFFYDPEGDVPAVTMPTVRPPISSWSTRPKTYRSVRAAPSST